MRLNTYEEAVELLTNLTIQTLNKDVVWNLAIPLWNRQDNITYFIEVVDADPTYLIKSKWRYIMIQNGIALEKADNAYCESLYDELYEAIEKVNYDDYNGEIL